MAWLRIEDTVPEHPKHLKAGPEASWLWVCALAYSQRQLSDGFIPDRALLCLMPEWEPDESQPSNSRVTPESQASSSGVAGESLASHSRVSDDDPPLKYPRIRTLAQRLVRAGLFERTKTGYLIHDYHDYNDTRSVALAKKKAVTEQRRTAGLASAAARSKQQTANGPVERALNPIPSHPIPVQEQAQKRDMGIQPVKPSNGNGNGHASLSSSDPFVNTEITMRAGEFVRQYEVLYQKCRNGALYAVKPAKDYASAVTLCHTWADDAHLLRLAKIFLTTDHKFAVEGSRTITQFLALASWCDGRLADVKAGKA